MPCGLIAGPVLFYTFMDKDEHRRHADEVFGRHKAEVGMARHACNPSTQRVEMED